uniref:Uncharacterized protein n=1 Tax=Octopus bimaculoides TaxID=37653 RepID=A0A0L8I653_OCTBM
MLMLAIILVSVTGYLVVILVENNTFNINKMFYLLELVMISLKRQTKKVSAK